MGCIQTYSGRKFDPLSPREEDICIEDIAHALSNTCRFSGHVKIFYSVAQHSCLVAENVLDEDKLWGLLHDAAEAYLVDLPRPIKQSLREYGIRIFDNMESSIMECICRKFGLKLKQPDSVDKADHLLLATEARDLMAPLADGLWIAERSSAVLPEVISPLDPLDAERRFLVDFDRYK